MDYSNLPNNLKYIPDIDYAQIGGRVLKLDALYPIDQPDQKMPAVVHIHGGGWRNGTHKDAGLNVKLAANGYFTVKIEYRLSTEASFPAQIKDCKAAVRWLRAHAEEYNIDTEKIGAIGGSAGGHLAALLGISAGAEELEDTGGWKGFSSRVNATVDCSGPVDLLKMDLWHKAFMNVAVKVFSKLNKSFENDIGETQKLLSESDISQLIGGNIKENIEKVEAANPINYITRGISPFLIIHGEVDPLVPIWQSQLLFEALKKCGTDVSFLPVGNMAHSYKTDIYGNSLEWIDDYIIEFFNKYLKL